MANPSNEKGEWKTIKGVHVFIRDGESVMNALNRQIAKDNGTRNKPRLQRIASRLV